MENASKALLIGGAVLIAIVLISIGVYIITSQSGVIKQSEEASNALTIKTFNGTFDKYVGTKKGSEIKNLCVDVRTSNSRNADHQVGLVLVVSGGNETDISTIQATINPYDNYTVKVTGQDSNGYITQLTIQ